MAAQNQRPIMDQFEMYFRRADLDQDGRIAGAEAISFFQATNLPKQVLAQIWTHADQNRTGFLGRAEFYNALKLVTVAQSKRDLTPDMVKAALYGPASAKIPAPQINLAALPTPQPNIRPPTPTPQFSGGAPTTSQQIGIRGPQDFPPQENQLRPPRPPPPNNAFNSQQGVVSQGLPGGGTMPTPRPPVSSIISTDWPGAGTGVSSTPSTTQGGFGSATSGLAPSAQPGLQVAPALTQPAAPKPNNATLTGTQVEPKDSRASAVSGNGFASDPIFGDVFSATSVQVKENSSIPTSYSSNLPVSSAIASTSAGPQTTIKPGPLGPSQNALPQQHLGTQHQQVQSTAKQSQQVPGQSFNAFAGGAGNLAPSQPHSQWPKMTQSAVQKYSKVFVEVDTDRDGKITGEQARNLFLSWKLPREVLKQVWDLSDQDNDSMLSLREFCVALYLMERYREGRPLPPVLPSNIFEDTQLPFAGQHPIAYGNATSRYTPGLPGPRPGIPAGGKPPRPVPIPRPDEESVQRSQQKPRVPVLEKDLVDQLSTEEQNALNSKFKELIEADKKVSELEKDILDSKEKIEFYRAKMQELVLYKSRCDNRLNEITERNSADKREVETLAKKYEEKYKQSGDVASKLTIEEATFRDIQEKKMELYRAIVKLEQEGSADKVQASADRIQLDLEEQVKVLNERCKTYGLRAKPTTLVELPFGWQPGIQEGAADWDENWDQFGDEGFVVVKELTLDVQNVVAPPKPKTSLVQKNESSTGAGATVPSSDVDGKSENIPGDAGKKTDHESEKSHKEEGVARIPPDSPANSQSKKLQDSPSKKSVDSNGSPHALEAKSEQGFAESRFDEPAWGSFDTHDDTDVGWDFSSDTAKDTNNGKHIEASLFGPDSWGLNPIKTESTQTDNMFPRKSTYTFDSVPGTPMSSYAASPHADNLFSKKSTYAFADSVPSTPMSSFGTSLFADNVSQKNSTFGFPDSVPSTPVFNSGNSPRGFDDRSFDSFSRFDSFSMHEDSGLFPSREFSRFDSMSSSTLDFDKDHGSLPPQDSFTRFDSFRSSVDSEYNPVFPTANSFVRFDSVRSARDSDHGHGFPSFDDTDPFGSSDPFKSTSAGSETPRRDSDSWKAF